jgi:hypothetical protein
VVERRNPFAPWAQQSPATAVSNLEKRADMAARALDQAQRDLAAARQRVPDDDDDKDDKIARRARQGTLDERERIRVILTSPIAARQPLLADTFAFQSDIPAAEAVAAMEAQAPHADATQRSAKEMAAKIVHMGKVRRGEAAATAGPKVFVKATAQSILAAAKKRDEK